MTSLMIAVAVVLLLIGAGIVIGVVARGGLAWDARHTRHQREAKVQADMDALMRAQQLNTAFLTARQALWDEARRHQTSGPR